MFKCIFNLYFVNCMQDYTETEISDIDCLKVALISVFVMCEVFRFYVDTFVNTVPDI